MAEVRVFEATCTRTGIEVTFRLTGDFGRGVPSGIADLNCPACGGEHLFQEDDSTYHARTIDSEKRK